MGASTPMKEIVLYYGPKSDFIQRLPHTTPIMTISALAIHSDRKMREHVFKIQGRRGEEPANEAQKMPVPCLVGFSDQYAAISESALQSFFSFIDQYDVETMYLQNPPIQVTTQVGNLIAPIKVIQYIYNTIDLNTLQDVNKSYSGTIIGQENALRKLLASLYPLCEKNREKPVTLLFYGPTGVGKSETALFLSRVMGQKLLRKQFSMFHGSEFFSYIFGGRHSQGSFAKDLMERESNVILLDEFDKANPVFHSAFYQLFDEGIYEDKNYHVDVKRAVIICTSNYASKEDAEEKLGRPLFARFDAAIGFNPLSEGTVIKILEKEYGALVDTLTPEELRLISLDSIHERLIGHAGSLDNSRQIRQLVRHIASEAILESIL
jgi:ATP-dependent Clp protease ATP-binding subunit ClpA